ncbi:MAG: polyphosphate kinase 1 [Acidimicrobiia bacterium]|nr:polyphosphate kinase 1 [Acidimicrobiia bacterium]MYE72349.1 polyphosphate kinase 1 [Acidimicrobiia bacterium]MYJ61436.1 polyphosphate kinase 1 [Acidimicrobiia bacterium]
MIAESIDTEAESGRFINRELSWLEFNSRVLAQAEDPSVPLLERVKFCAIWSSNLDEFFQVRVAGLKDQLAGQFTGVTPDGRTAAQQLHEIRIEVDDQMDRAARCLSGLTVELADAGIEILNWDDLDDEDRKFLSGEFDDRIYPVLTPLAVDLGHPFPYISNLSLSLGVLMIDPADGHQRFARLKVPATFGRFIQLPDEHRFVPVEQVVAAHLPTLFPGMEITETVAFRVTRNADLAVDEGEAQDLLAAVEVELRRRRFRSVVRLEVEHLVSSEIRSLLIEELDIERDDVYEVDTLLELSSLWDLFAVDRPDLKNPSWQPVNPLPSKAPGDQPIDLFACIREGDILVHHPYDSFTATVQEFIWQAANDPKVLAIKLTLYRTSGDSPIVRSLIRAAESGKQVAVVVELKARFDEEANIEWARRLEQAGVHVAYGLVGLKVHAKTCLVVREEADGVRRYCHIGTGNYNSITARVYTDLGLFTADPEVGVDLTQLFNSLTGYGRDIQFRRLVPAPQGLRPTVTELIRNEAARGPEGRIIIKMNSLADAEMVEALYEASQAGVEIDLIVRAICCLRPGVPGMSDTIRVRSLIGRYLEHSRIYYFGNGEDIGAPAYYIGSADLMPRNLNRRIEALVAVVNPDLRRRLDQVLEFNLRDDELAWDLMADGSWQRVPTSTGFEAHTAFERLVTGPVP